MGDNSSLTFLSIVAPEYQRDERPLPSPRLLDATAKRSDTSLTLPKTPTRPKPAKPIPVQKIDMVAIDLDGTLLRTDKRISKRAVKVIKEVTEAGVKVVLATARPPRGTREIWELLELETYQALYNGAMILDPTRNKHIYHKPLEPAMTKKMIKLARKADKDVVVSLEILDKWYTDHVDESLPTETSRRFSPDFVGPLDSFLHVPVTKLLLLAPPERIGKIRKAVEAKVKGKVTTAIADEHLLQYIHVEANKANALKLIAEKYGISQKNVMAIGDAPNDVAMLRWAGLGVAVANGWDITRKVADVIAPPNDENGVAFALQQYVLNQR